MRQNHFLTRPIKVLLWSLFDQATIFSYHFQKSDFLESKMPPKKKQTAGYEMAEFIKPGEKP